MNKNSVNKYILPVLTAFTVYILLIIFWEQIVLFFHISPITLVRPNEIIPIIISARLLYIKALLFTFYEIWWGWFIGNILGIILAICLYQFKNISRVLVSLCVLINAIPLIALSAIIAGFLGTTPLSKIIITALICFFPIFISTLSGFTHIEKNHAYLFQTYGATRLQKFYKLVLPTGLPFIMTSLKLNVLSAIFAAITGEFFGSYGGIGQLILANRGLYNLSMVWGAIFYIIVMGAFFYFVVGLLQKKVVYWKQ